MYLEEVNPFLCPASDSVHHGVESSVGGLRNYFIYKIKKRDRAPIFYLSSVPFFRYQFKSCCAEVGE